MSVQSPAEVYRLDEIAGDLDALSNPQRLRLLKLLTRPRYGEELAQILEMSRQSALKHIKKLEERGFVRAMHGRRDTGPVIEYQVVPQRIFALSVAIGDLGKLEPEGGPQVRVEEQTMPMSIDLVTGEEVVRSPVGVGCLLVVNGPMAGHRVVLEGDEPRWTLGRADDRTISVKHDPYASSRHCEVQFDRTGHALVDAHSANGTFLNFSRIPRGGRVPIKPGDIIGVGHTQIVYQREQ